MNRAEWAVLAVAGAALGFALSTVRALHAAGLLLLGIAGGVALSVVGTLARDAFSRRRRAD